MGTNGYRLTAAQVICLRGEDTVQHTSPYPASGRYPDTLPPVTNQAGRGSCVAHAVAALVACHEGCRRRISVQYIDEVTHLVEHEWVTRNIALLKAGKAPEPDFASTFASAVAQARLLVQANGTDSEATNAFLASLTSRLLSRLSADTGCHLKHAFEAIERYGACRDELWPYASVTLNTGVAGGDAVGDFPPGTHEDARRHRIVNDLYVLRAPNNVNEIKGLLTGANGRRPMPVCAGIELFTGCTETTLALPELHFDGTQGEVVPKALGLHEVLIFGYEDDAHAPGGGYFHFQNSWGTNWGKQGCGRVPYAYFACFCQEAGTILQELEDYGSANATARIAPATRRTTRGIWGLAAACALACVGIAVGYLWPKPAIPPQPPIPIPPQPPAYDTRTPAPHKPSARPKTVDKDDEIKTAKIIDYHFQVRGTCDTSSEAHHVAKRITGEHRTFTFAPFDTPPNAKFFEGEVIIEGEVGWLPDPRCIIETYLERKKIETPVRKWDMKRLRNHQTTKSKANAI